MEYLIKQLLGLQQKCKDYGDNLAKIIGKAVGSDLRIGCFAMLFNSTIMTLELLSYYYNIWKGPYAATQKVFEQLRKENAQRCMNVTKWQFIQAISSIEYCAKETINHYPHHSLAKWCQKQTSAGRRVYLKGIMNRSKRIGLIDDREHRSWECILEVRNTSVHNNAISDFDKIYQIDGLEVSFIKGEMMKGKLDFYVKLTDKAIDLYHSWVMNFV